jgi:hypothetical protein
MLGAQLRRKCEALAADCYEALATRLTQIVGWTASICAVIDFFGHIFAICVNITVCGLNAPAMRHVLH